MALRSLSLSGLLLPVSGQRFAKGRKSGRGLLGLLTQPDQKAFSLGAPIAAAARASNQALAAIGPSIQWQHTYVAGDKTYCIYLAEAEADIHRHSEPSGIPVPSIAEIGQIIDPLAANNQAGCDRGKWPRQGR